MLYTVGKKIHCNKCFEFNFLGNNFPSYGRDRMCTWKLLIKHLNGGKRDMGANGGGISSIQIKSVDPSTRLAQARSNKFDGGDTVLATAVE